MIRVQNLSTSAANFRLSNISFEIARGEYAVLMGRTGSGKTTLLECLCGLRKITSGEIWFGSRNVTHLPTSQRGIGYVPQDGALFSHMTVYEHLTFPLEIRGWDRKRVEARANELVELLDLAELLDRFPRSLSGGETQRVALGRALSFEPEILLLDEPLSALDDESREKAYEVLRRVQRVTRVTALHITHSSDESTRLADRALRLIDGRICDERGAESLPASSVVSRLGA